jgi:hypothetical protein
LINPACYRRALRLEKHWQDSPGGIAYHNLGG